MKYALVALSLALAVRAQSRDDIPDCAIPCLEDAIKDSGKCDVNDDACACANIETIQGAATGCVLEKCEADVAVGEVLPAVKALCEAVGSGDGGDKEEGDKEEGKDDKEEGKDDEHMEPMPEPTKSKDEECSTYHPVPAPSGGNHTEPKPEPEPTDGEGDMPTPAPTAGAAMLGSIGAVAMAGLAALAL